MSDAFSPGVRRLRRRALVRRLTIAGVLLVVLLLTALLWPRPLRGPLAVATASAPPSARGVLAGPLRAVREGDGVCYSIASTSGTAVLVFPRGWSADDDLGLRDPSGLVIAVPGDGLTVIGDPGAIGTAPGCSDRGRVWALDSLRVRDPS